MNNRQGLLKLTIEEYYEGETRCFYVEDENGISQIYKNVDEDWISNFLKMCFNCKEAMLRSQGKLPIANSVENNSETAENSVLRFPATKMA